MAVARWTTEARLTLQQVLTLHAQSSVAQKAKDCVVSLDSKKYQR